MQDKKSFLGTEPVGKLLFRLAVPTVTAQIVNMLYNIVDRIFIGHIPQKGTLALSGVGVCFPVVILIMAFSNLIGMGGAPRIAMRLGKNDEEGAEEILGTCLKALVLLSLGLIPLFLLLARPMLYFFGASGDTMPYALSYLKIYLLGTPAAMIALGANCFITTQVFTRVSMMTVMIGALANILLDPIFIFVFRLGTPGAALATVLSQIISALWVLRFLTGPSTQIRVKRKNLKLKRSILQQVLGLGLAPFTMTGTESLLNIAFNASLQKYGGDLAVSTMTVLASSMHMIVLPVMGLGQGAQPIISYNLGAKNWSRVKKAMRLTVISTTTCSTTAWGIVMLFPMLIPSIFSKDPELIQSASWAIRIYLGGVLAVGIQEGCQQSFLALGEAKTSLFLAFLRKLFLLIPLIFLLPQLLSAKVFAVFLAEPLADLTAVCVTFTLFCLKYRKIGTD